MNDQNKLWGGRFHLPTHALMEQFSQSVSFDYRLYQYDILGSIAHARMLSVRDILTDEEFRDIEKGLLEIGSEIDAGDFEWSVELEDVHMNIESALTKKIGEAGKKLHTGRSRNDQVATDIRLYIRDALEIMCLELTEVQRVLIAVAERETNSIMPGYTHMQSAQPVTFGHHVLAWNEMFQRDFERLVDCRKRVNISPLGCAALAGTSYPIDREMTAKELGFDAVSVNSLDSVSDRDFVIEFSAAMALIMTHLSRISEELVLWSSPAFDFVDLGDQFCTGSSIMPQKKNPDVVELTRGKSGRVTGNLMSLLMLMKGQPLTYNRDNQEDKEPLFDSIDSVSLTLRIFAAMIPGIQVKRENLYQAASAGFSTATDLADYLVKKNIPFRDAHEVVGKIVAHASEKQFTLSELPLSELQGFSEKISEDVYQILTLEGSVNSRDHIGGTAPNQVLSATQMAKKLLDARPSYPV